jgi:glycosyltransferase involved in cell wall biosynthesis
MSVKAVAKKIIFFVARVLNLCRKPYDLVILDDIYPHLLSQFRIIEYSAYLNRYRARVLTTTQAFGLIYETASFEEVLKKYLEIYPAHEGKIVRFRPYIPVRARLFYFVFQSNGEFFLDYIEKNRTPFVFTLYPGGGFNLKDPNSLARLRRIFASEYFREVIVTQQAVLRYLTNHRLCAPEQIHFIYGTPVNAGTLLPEIQVGEDDRFNVCFAAQKYTPQGRDKGYDIFIEAMRALLPAVPALHIHILGNFDETDVFVGDLSEHITFHGSLYIAEMREIFSQMHAIVSPNLSNVLADGAFDGFPTAVVQEASLMGVAMFVADDLQQNLHYEPDSEIVLISHNPEEIADKLLYYYNNRQRLTELRGNGMKKTFALSSFDHHIRRREDILNKYINN